MKQYYYDLYSLVIYNHIPCLAGVLPELAVQDVRFLPPQVRRVQGRWFDTKLQAYGKKH